MFTGGTAVPGTVVSTTQDVQAADETTVNDVMSAVEGAFNTSYPERTLITGQNYTISEFDNTVIDAESVKSTLETALDWANNYPDYTLTVDSVNGVNSVKNGTPVTATITVSDGSTSSRKTLNFKTIIKTANDVKSEVALSLDKIAPSISFDEKVGSNIAASVDSLLEIVLKEIPAYTTYEKNYTYSATSATLKSQNDSEKVWDVTIKITNTDDDTDTVSYTLPLTVAYNPSDTDASIAKDLILGQMDNKDFEVSDSSKVNEEVKSKIEDTLKLAGFTIGTSNATNDKKIKNVAVTGEIYTQNEWSGTVVISDTSTSSVTFALHLNIIEESAAVVENIAVINPKEEVEIGSTLENTLDGVKLSYSNGTVESVKPEKMAEKGIKWDATTFDGNKLGTYTITLYKESEDTVVSASYDVNVIKTETLNTKNDVGVTDVEDIYSVSSSDTSIADVKIKKESDGTIKGVEVKAKKAGTTILTVTAKDGKVYTKTLIYNANGNRSNTADAEEVKKADRYIWNDANVIGFVPTSYELTQLSEDGEDTGVVTVEETSLSDDPVFKLTPGINGTATLTFKGGNDGKLTASYTIKVTADKFEIAGPTHNYNKEELNSTALEKIAAYKFDGNGITNQTPRTIDVSELGFDENDKVVISKDSTVVDTLNAADAVKAQITENNGKFELVLTYGKDLEISTVITGQKIEICQVDNTIDNLGLIAEEGAISEEDIKNVATEDYGKNLVNAEVKKDSTGTSYLYITPGADADTKTRTVAITVTDKLGNEAVVEVKVTKAAVKKSKVTKFTGYEGYKLDGAASRYTFTLGEDVSSFGNAVIKNSAGAEIALTPEMILVDGKAFTTSEATLSGTTVTPVKASLSTYGGLTSKNDIFEIVVKPVIETLTVSDLGLSSDDSVKTVSVGGDTGIIASVKDGAVRIQANKVSQNSFLTVTTKDGKSLAVKVSVDENGELSTDIVRDFQSSYVTVTNDVDTLGFIADTVSTSDDTVAIAKLAGDRITIHSVAPGKASIYAENGDTMTTIYVTVDDFGIVTIDNIVKATDNGFVRGETITEGEYAGLDNWYYYIDGEMVTNNWVEVNENGTNVWYHFDKDGKMSRGWIIDESGWKIYNLDSNGRMRKDMWINAAANDALGMPAGLYHLQSDGAVQMNGWAESVTAGIYWYCNAGTGLFEQENPASWANSKLW